MPQPPHQQTDQDREVTLDDEQDRLDVPGWVASVVLDVARGGSREGGQAREASVALAAAGAGELASPGPTLASVLERLAEPALDWRVTGLRGAGSGCLSASGGVAALPYDGGSRVIFGLHALEGLAAVFGFVAPVPDRPAPAAAPPPPLTVPADTFAEAIGRRSPPPGLPPQSATAVQQVLGGLTDQWRLELVPGGAPAGARGTGAVEMLEVGPVLALLHDRGASEELRAASAEEIRAAQRRLADRAVEQVRKGAGGPAAAPVDASGRDRFGPRPQPGGADAPTVVLGAGLPGEPAPTVADAGEPPATAVLGEGLPGEPAPTAPPEAATNDDAPGAGVDLGKRDVVEPTVADEAPSIDDPAPAAPVDEPRTEPAAGPDDPSATDSAPGAPAADGTVPQPAPGDGWAPVPTLLPDEAPGVERTVDGHPVRFGAQEGDVLVVDLAGPAAGALDDDGRLRGGSSAHRAGLDLAARHVAARGDERIRWDVARADLARAWARELERLGHPIGVRCAAAADEPTATPPPSAAVVLWRGARDAGPPEAGARLLAVAEALRSAVGADGLRITEPDGGVRALRPDAETLGDLVRRAAGVGDDAVPPRAWDALGRHLVVELVAGDAPQPRARLTARVLVEPAADRGDALVADLAPDLAPDVAAAALAPLVEAWDADWACVETEATGWLRRTDPGHPDVLLDAGRSLDARLHWRTWFGASHRDAVDVEALHRAARVTPHLRVRDVAGGVEVALGERWTGDDAVVARAARLEPAAFRGA